MNIPTIPDKELIAALEKRHALLIKWLTKQAKDRRASLIPEPHPLDFAMSSEDEKANELHRISYHNAKALDSAECYEYVLEAIRNYDRTFEADKHYNVDFSI
jgi:hypothetical protein